MKILVVKKAVVAGVDCAKDTILQVSTSAANAAIAAGDAAVGEALDKAVAARAKAKAAKAAKAAEDTKAAKAAKDTKTK